MEQIQTMDFVSQLNGASIKKGFVIDLSQIYVDHGELYKDTCESNQERENHRYKKSFHWKLNRTGRKDLGQHPSRSVADLNCHLKTKQSVNN